MVTVKETPYIGRRHFSKKYSPLFLPVLSPVSVAIERVKWRGEYSCFEIFSAMICSKTKKITLKILWTNTWDNPNKEAHWTIDESSVDNSWVYFRICNGRNWVFLVGSAVQFHRLHSIRIDCSIFLQDGSFQEAFGELWRWKIRLLDQRGRAVKESNVATFQHDVFLILFFALFTDIVEFRIHLLIIFDLQYRGDYYGDMKYIPTTVSVRINYRLSFQKWAGSTCLLRVGKNISRNYNLIIITIRRVLSLWTSSTPISWSPTWKPWVI